MLYSFILCMCFDLITGEVWLLRFEYVEDENQPIIKIYDSKNDIIKHTLISKGLYEEIIEFRFRLCVVNKYHNQQEIHQEFNLNINIISWVIQRNQLKKYFT